MEHALSLLCGVMTAASLYLMLEGNLIRFIFGFVLASNTVNLIIFVAGRLTNAHPPLIPEGAEVSAMEMANALPQALILTAIVISFALLAFVFILFYRSYEVLGTVNAERMRFAEPEESRPEGESGGKGEHA